jgi:hypothetical protein
MSVDRSAADDSAGHFCPVDSAPMLLHRPDLRPIYTIDALDRLVELNRAFVRSFAPESAHADAHAVQALIGRPIWDFVSGRVPRQLWEVLYDRVRAVSAPIFVPLRADTASQRCVIDLELHPVGDRSIRHVRECVSLESRPAVALLDPNYPRDDRTLFRCAWCARIQVRLGFWQEIEEAQASLRLEATASLPTICDSACSACTQSVLKTFPARVA